MRKYTADCFNSLAYSRYAFSSVILPKYQSLRRMQGQKLNTIYLKYLCADQEGGSKPEPKKPTEKGKNNEILFRNWTFVRHGSYLFQHTVLVAPGLICWLDNGHWPRYLASDFNNESDFTQLVNLRSRWRLKRFQCPVTKAKKIMVFDWLLKRLRHFLNNYNISFTLVVTGKILV